MSSFRDFLQESTSDKIITDILMKIVNQLPNKDKKKYTAVIEAELIKLLNSNKLNISNVEDIFKKYNANPGPVTLLYDLLK